MAVRKGKSEKTAESEFTKQELMESKKFANKRDLAAAILEDGKTYTIANAEQILNDFLKGEVKVWH